MPPPDWRCIRLSRTEHLVEEPYPHRGHRRLPHRFRSPSSAEAPTSDPEASPRVPVHRREDQRSAGARSGIQDHRFPHPARSARPPRRGPQSLPGLIPASDENSPRRSALPAAPPRFLVPSPALSSARPCAWPCRNPPAPAVPGSTDWLRQRAEKLRDKINRFDRAPTGRSVSGLIVSNHLSYIDIILLAAQRPCVFVSKQRSTLVAHLPANALRWVAPSLSIANTGGDVAAVADVMREDEAALMKASASSSSRRAPARAVRVCSRSKAPCSNRLYSLVTHPVTAASPSVTRLEEGSVPNEIRYWRDMTRSAPAFAQCME